jgi:sister chromatid cohesion protein DCC1
VRTPLVHLFPRLFSHPCSLKIKAASTSTATTHTGATADHAVLCTSDKTFSLRQVHSSNTSFLLSPQTSEGGVGGITATSTVTSYIELLPVTPDTKSLLRPLLLPYPTAATSSSGSKSNVGMSKVQLRNNLPVSDAEFESAWTDLSAFEYNNSSYISTAEGLLSALKEAFTNAAASGVKLCAPFRLDALLDNECEIPSALVETVVARICERKGDGWVLLPEKATHVVGRWVLEEWHTSGKPDMLYVSFMSRWKAAVPQECKLLCKLDVLKVRHLSNYLWRARKGC